MENSLFEASSLQLSNHNINLVSSFEAAGESLDYEQKL